MVRDAKVMMSFRMAAEERDALDAWAAASGYASRTEAIEAAVLAAVHDEAGAKLEEMAAQIEERVAKAASRATKAALAALCLAAAGHDPRQARAIGSLSAQGVLDWAWEMGGRCQAMGERPDFAAALAGAKGAAAKAASTDAELASAAYALDPLDMLSRVSGEDAEAWAAAWCDYDATRGRLAGTSSLDASVEGNRARYDAAVAAMATILRGMGLDGPGEVSSLARMACAAWEGGVVFEASAEELAGRRARRAPLLPASALQG